MIFLPRSSLSRPSISSPFYPPSTHRLFPASGSFLSIISISPPPIPYDYPLASPSPYKLHPFLAFALRSTPPCCSLSFFSPLRPSFIYPSLPFPSFSMAHSTSFLSPLSPFLRLFFLYPSAFSIPFPLFTVPSSLLPRISLFRNPLG